MSINKPLLILVLLIIGSLVLVGVLAPDFLAAQTSFLLDAIVNNLGWFYLIVVFCIFVFLFVLAVSKWGKIKLGNPASPLDFLI